MASSESCSAMLATDVGAAVSRKIKQVEMEMTYRLETQIYRVEMTP